MVAVGWKGHEVEEPIRRSSGESSATAEPAWRTLQNRSKVFLNTNSSVEPVRVPSWTSLQVFSSPPLRLQLFECDRTLWFGASPENVSYFHLFSLSFLTVRKRQCHPNRFFFSLLAGDSVVLNKRNKCSFAGKDQFRGHPRIREWNNR